MLRSNKTFTFTHIYNTVYNWYKKKLPELLPPQDQ